MMKYNKPHFAFSFATYSSSILHPPSVTHPVGRWVIVSNWNWERSIAHSLICKLTFWVLEGIIICKAFTKGHARYNTTVDSITMARMFVYLYNVSITPLE